MGKKINATKHIEQVTESSEHQNAKCVCELTHILFRVIV